MTSPSDSSQRIRSIKLMSNDDLSIIDASISCYIYNERDEKLIELAKNIRKDLRLELFIRKPMVYSK